MTRRFFLMPLIMLFVLYLASCGDNGNGSGDTTTDDAAQPDRQDQQTDTLSDIPEDTPEDHPADHPADQPVDTPVEDVTEDPAADEVTEIVDDDVEQDAVPDPTEPDSADVPVDTVIACEAREGYCTTYPVILDPCVTCDPIGDTYYRPAAPGDGAMGCTVGGVGTAAWCCLPKESVVLPSDCDRGGGECYPSGGLDPCPVGWDAVRTSCGDDDRVCCMPGESCT